MKQFRLDRKSTGAHNLEGLWGPLEGDLLYDMSATGGGRGNHATRAGTGPRSQYDPQRGHCMLFNGTDDVYDCERSLINVARNDGIRGLYTLMAWVWLDPAVTQTYAGIISEDAALAANSWRFSVMNSHLATARLRFATVGIVALADPGTFHGVKGEWVHVALTRRWDGLAGFNTVWSLYQNAVLMDSAIGGGLRADDPMAIGSGMHDANRWWHGMIDDVRQYSRCLTAAQITHIYETTRYHPYADLMLRPTRRYAFRHRGEGVLM